jgi:hypothetical protein
MSYNAKIQGPKWSTTSIKWRILSRPTKIGSGKNKKNLYFSYWAWKSPWGHVLGLITFCQILVIPTVKDFERIDHLAECHFWAKAILN